MVDRIPQRKQEIQQQYPHRNRCELRQQTGNEKP